MDMKIIIFILAIFSNALANIFIKYGVNRTGGLKFDSVQSFISGFILNPFIIIGVIFFGFTLVGYTQTLRYYQLSVAYPVMTSLGFIIVVGASVLLFKEQLSYTQMIGIITIIIGVWLTAS
jgi:multidrug transporter EmrE-like cation transporter